MLNLKIPLKRSQVSIPFLEMFTSVDPFIEAAVKRTHVEFDDSSEKEPGNNSLSGNVTSVDLFIEAGDKCTHVEFEDSSEKELGNNFLSKGVTTVNPFIGAGESHIVISRHRKRKPSEGQKSSKSRCTRAHSGHVGDWSKSLKSKNPLH